MTQSIAQAANYHGVTLKFTEIVLRKKESDKKHLTVLDFIHLMICRGDQILCMS